VDVGSSRAANSVVGMVQGATSSMIIDLAGIVTVLEEWKEGGEGGGCISSMIIDLPGIRHHTCCFTNASREEGTEGKNKGEVKSEGGGAMMTIDLAVHGELRSAWRMGGG